MNRHPKVSCICPTYGRVAALGEALDSFLLQTYAPRELVILNDAPVKITDIHGEGLQRVARLDCGGGHWTAGPGVDVIVANAPLFETLGDKYNALLDLATGDIIAHWEDDDLWFPNHLETNVWRLLGDPGLECVKNDTAWVLERSGPDAPWHYAGWSENVFESQMVFWRDAAREIRYARSHQRQSLHLLDEFRVRKTLGQQSVHPWNTYVFRWDTSFLHAELIGVEGRTIEKWRETNQDFGDVLVRRPCAPYLSLVLRDLDSPTAKPPLPADEASLVRGWLGRFLPLGSQAPCGHVAAPGPTGRARAVHGVPVAGSPPLRAPVAAPVPRVRSRGTIAFLTRKGYRVSETKPIVEGLEASGYKVTFQEDQPSLDGLIRGIERLRPRPVAVLRWEEHGCLFRTAAWEEFLLYLCSHAIAPIYFDYGYFDRTKHVLVDLYRPPALATIREEWGTLPTTVDWNAAPPSVREYRAHLLSLHERALAERPLEERPYGVIWPQQSPTLLRDALRGKAPGNWVATACECLRANGLEPVVRLSPYQRDLVLPPGVKTFGGPGMWDAGLNARLAAHAKADVICCSSVSNELVLLEKPVVALGKSWFAGLDVFYEPQDWDDLRHAALPPDGAVRARWVNWWLKRQCKPTDAAAAVEGEMSRFRACLTPARAKPPSPLYITFHTDDPYYRKTVMPLLASLRRFGLPYRVYSFPNTGDWKKNTFLKVRACRRALLDHPENSVVFLDADAEVMAPPKLFETLPVRADFAAHFLRGSALLLSGTLWFNNTTAAMRLLDEWERRQQPALLGDQDALGMAVHHCKAHGLRVVHLPPAYTRVNEMMRHVTPVIAHRFAHRHGKAAVRRAAL